MDTAELQSLKIKELTKLAQEMNVQNFAGLKKQELIVTLLEAEAKMMVFCIPGVSLR